MNTKIILSAVCIGLLAFSSAQLSAEPGNPGQNKPKNHDCPLFSELGLSNAQKDSLKLLHREMQTIREKHIQEVRAVRQKIKTELLKAEPSQNVLYGYAGELGELHKQISKEHGDHLLKVKKLLTAEQFATIVNNDKGMAFDKAFRMCGKDSCEYKDGNCPHKKRCCPMKRGASDQKKCCPTMQDK